MMTDHFEPLIIGFTCNWCSYRAADMAGTGRVKYPPNIRLIRLMCSGRLDPTFVLKALSSGADGVLITGCDPARVKLVWASAAEGVHLAKEITSFVEEIRALGPLNWPVHTHVSEAVKQRQ